MPSKKKNRGSPIVKFRVPADLLATIDKQIEACNRTRRDEPYTRTSFILAALRERFEKYERARKAARRKKPMTADELQAAAAAVPTDIPLEERLAALDAIIEPFMNGEPAPHRPGV